MNKADEKRLKKDPRYKRIAAAKAALDARLAAAKAAYDAEVEAARAAYAEAAPEMSRTFGSLYTFEEQALEALRAVGDKVTVNKAKHGGEQERLSCEVENITETQITIVGFSKAFRLDGAYRGGDYWTSYRIDEADVERIKAGEIKGWRQKPWG